MALCRYWFFFSLFGLRLELVASETADRTAGCSGSRSPITAHCTLEPRHLCCWWTPSGFSTENVISSKGRIFSKENLIGNMKERREINVKSHQANRKRYRTVMQSYLYHCSSLQGPNWFKGLARKAECFNVIEKEDDDRIKCLPFLSAMTALSFFTLVTTKQCKVGVPHHTQ